MKNLIWQIDGYGWTTDDAGKVYPLASKPALSFQFDALYYEPLNTFYVYQGARHDLTADQITECTNFINAQTQQTQQLVMGVDNRGKYLGWVTADKAYKQVSNSPWTNDPTRYDFNLNAWLLIKAVDSTGKYIGNVDMDAANFFQDVQSVPPNSFDIWDFTAKGWKDGRTLDQLKSDLCDNIDSLADEQALHYVTQGWTQGARYQQKLQQCQDYKTAGYPNSDTPASIDASTYPYVYWESNQTGQTGKVMADGVLQQGLGWATRGGMIEGYRIGGKKNVKAATTAAAAQTAHDTAITDIGNV